MASESQKEKEQFFAEQDSLHCSDEEESSTAAAHLRSLRSSRNEVASVSTRPSISSSIAGKLDYIDPVPTLKRALSAPSWNVRTSKTGEASASTGGLSPPLTCGQLPPQLNRPSPFDRKTLGAKEPVIASKPKMTGKRGQENSPVLVPESRRVFQGLVFFFIPNNDVAQRRRMRINKAREYGALRAESWNRQITHVIVDIGLNFEDVMKSIRFESFPSGVTLVNETYPSECISFRAMIDASQSQFRVQGFNQPIVEKAVFHSSNENLVRRLPPSQKDASTKPPQRIPPAILAEEDYVQVEHAVTLGTLGLSAKEPFAGAESRNEPSDELDAAIGETKSVTDLPLDQDEGQTEISDYSDGEASEEEHQRKKPKKSGVRKQKTEDWQKNFTCMQKHDGLTADSNPNGRTIEVLGQMATYYDRTNDQWRTNAYRKAITALKKQTEKVSTKEQALSIPFIGDRLASKIEEIVLTNRLRRLDNIDKDHNEEVLQKFMKVYGAGYAVAQRWIAQGHRSLEDLVEKASLTDNQMIGIEHYDDFLTRIPRVEVEAHGKVVQDFFRTIDPEIQVTIGGSFRRGALNSGDIDLIITKPDASLEWLRDLLLRRVLPELFKEGFLKATLASLSHGHGSKWHGASAIPGVTTWRRIDLLLVPWEEIGAALIYFTGNDIFNRSIRLLASKKGMRLNQHALFKDVMRGPGRAKLNEGTIVEGKDEKRIFDILGVPWRPPEHRNC